MSTSMSNSVGIASMSNSMGARPGSEYVIVQPEPESSIVVTWAMWLLVLVAMILLINELFGQPSRECFKAGDLLSKKIANKLVN